MENNSYTFKVRRMPFPGVFDYIRQPVEAKVTLESNDGLYLDNVYVLKHIAYGLMDGDITVEEIHVVNPHARGENWFFSRIEMERNRDTIDKIPMAECIQIAKTTIQNGGYPPTNIAVLARAIYSMYLSKTGPKGKLRHEYLRNILEWMLYLVNDYIETQEKKYA